MKPELKKLLLLNLPYLLFVSQYWQYVARAALLFGSLAIDFYRQRNRQKKLLADSMKNL